MKKKKGFLFATKTHCYKNKMQKLFKWFGRDDMSGPEVKIAAKCKNSKWIVSLSIENQPCWNSMFLTWIIKNISWN